MTFNDFKDVIDSLPVEIENLTEESRLVEDMGLDEEDCFYKSPENHTKRYVQNSLAMPV